MPLSAVQDTYCENTFRVPVGSVCLEVTLRLRNVVLDSEFYPRYWVITSKCQRYNLLKRFSNNNLEPGSRSNNIAPLRGGFISEDTERFLHVLTQPCHPSVLRIHTGGVEVACINGTLRERQAHAS